MDLRKGASDSDLLCHLVLLGGTSRGKGGAGGGVQNRTNSKVQFPRTRDLQYNQLTQQPSCNGAPLPLYTSAMQRSTVGDFHGAGVKLERRGGTVVALTQTRFFFVFF